MAIPSAAAWTNKPNVVVHVVPWWLCECETDEVRFFRGDDFGEDPDSISLDGTDWWDPPDDLDAIWSMRSIKRKPEKVDKTLI